MRTRRRRRKKKKQKENNNNNKLAAQIVRKYKVNVFVCNKQTHAQKWYYTL